MSRTYQVHANVNADHGDAGLRVTITLYDEAGHEESTSTWRKHVRNLDFDGSAWQAYSAVVELCRMMAEVAGAPALAHTEPDEPLPGF